MIVIANLLPKLQTVNILVRPLSKKRRFRTRFHIQHVKASKILAKSPFFQIFVPFLDSTSNFEHFERKDDCHS